MNTPQPFIKEPAFVNREDEQDGGIDDSLIGGLDDSLIGGLDNSGKGERGYKGWEEQN